MVSVDLDHHTLGHVAGCNTRVSARIKRLRGQLLQEEELALETCTTGTLGGTYMKGCYSAKSLS
jgi:hypothetical protein